MGRFNWNWGGEGPPDEAYSRVTEPERFAPLHGWALEAVARLQTEYEATLNQDGVTDSELKRSPLSRPLIKFTPIQDSSAPITIAFTDFPGLGLRMGRWFTDYFPSCGCDACDEVPEDEFERFTELLSDVVAGGLGNHCTWVPEAQEGAAGNCGMVSTAAALADRRCHGTRHSRFWAARRKLPWSGLPGNQEPARPPISSYAMVASARLLRGKE